MPIYIDHQFIEGVSRLVIENRGARDIEIQEKHSSIPTPPSSTKPLSPTGLSG